MKYITIGKDELLESHFRDFRDDSNQEAVPGAYKARSAGLWLTEFDENRLNVNSWMEYILCMRSEYFYPLYRHNGHIDSEIPCSVVSLEDDVKIFQLDSYDQFQHLLKNYPYSGGNFSYKLLSNRALGGFDGMYVNLSNYRFDLKRMEREAFKSNNLDEVYRLRRESVLLDAFAVDTLLLFNLDCIDYYHSGKVVIDYLSPSPHDFSDYHIEVSDVKKKVLKK